MKPFSFVALILLLSVFASCNKEKEPPFFGVDDHLKSEFVYKVGTYWIYRDSISGRIDSAYVTENFSSVREISNGKFESVATKIIQREIGLFPADTTYWWVILEGTYIYLGYEHDSSSQSFRTEAISYPEFNNTTINVEAVKNLNIAGIQYPLLYKVPYRIPEIPSLPVSYNKDFFYLDRKNWMVMMDLDHPAEYVRHVWQLLRCHIVK